MKILKSALLILCMGLLLSNTVYAAQRIAILNFELNDITSLPNTPEERLRTASIHSLLEQAISQSGDYEIVHINVGAQAAANSSFGYLFH